MYSMDTHRDTGKENRWLFHPTTKISTGFTWKDHVSNKELYAEVRKVTDTVKQKGSS